MTYIFSADEIHAINGSLPVLDAAFDYADLAIVFGTRFPMPVAIAADVLARGKDCQMASLSPLPDDTQASVAGTSDNVSMHLRSARRTT